jgi:hypothetical protein
MTQEYYEIDGRNFSTLEEFVQEATIKGLFQMRDRSVLGISKDEGTDEGSRGEHAILIWKNSHLSKERLGREGTIRWLEERVKKGEQVDVESYKEQLDRGEGKTLYEVLVEGVEVILKGEEERKVEIRFE